MTLGTLGAGQVAQAFAIHLLEAGHEVLLSNGRGPDILDAPAEYPYSLGYFAVYSADPDGLKFEFAHAPGYDRYRIEPTDHSTVSKIGFAG